MNYTDTERLIRGKEETISYIEMEETTDALMTELLAYIFSMVDEATEDEEERATAKTNFATMVGKLGHAYFMAGFLVSPKKFMEKMFPEDFRESGTIENVEETENR